MQWHWVRRCMLAEMVEMTQTSYWQMIVWGHKNPNLSTCHQQFSKLDFSEEIEQVHRIDLQSWGLQDTVLDPGWLIFVQQFFAQDHMLDLLAQSSGCHLDPAANPAWILYHEILYETGLCGLVVLSDYQETNCKWWYRGCSFLSHWWSQCYVVGTAGAHSRLYAAFYHHCLITLREKVERDGIIVFLRLQPSPHCCPKSHTNFVVPGLQL